MPNPILLFAFVIATMFGLAFHVVLGGNARRMVLFIITSWLGFLLGQYAGGYLDISLPKIGILHLIPASVSAIALLIFAHFLTLEPGTAVPRR